MKIGDKVICVDFSRNEFYGVPPSLLPNVPYVVREVGSFSGEMFINLIGVTAPFDTIGWRAKRFRILSELKGAGGMASDECPSTKANAVVAAESYQGRIIPAAPAHFKR